MRTAQDQREYKRKLRADRIAWGMCTVCGKKLDVRGFKMCLSCRLWWQEYNASRQRKPLTEAQKERYRANSEKRRQERLVQGLCSQCGGRKVRQDMKMCERCRVKQQQRYRDSKWRGENAE